MKKGLLSAVLSIAVGAGSLFPGDASAEIRFGILPRLSVAELTTMFTPLADYLARETGEKVTLVIPKDFDAFKELVRKGEVELGYANSLIYVQLKQNTAVEPLAVSAEKEWGTKFRGIIIARKDSAIHSVQDLKGKKLMFVEKDSAAGYVFQMLLLSKAGLDVQKDFVTLPFAKKHDNVTLAVFNKSADAGGIREGDLDKMKDKVDLSQMKTVAYTEFFPNWPVFSTAKLSAGVGVKVAAALLKLKPNAPESVGILGPAKLTAFAPVTDKEYDQLRTAARVAGAF